MPLSRRTLIGASLAATTAAVLRPAHAAANVLRIGISTSLIPPEAVERRNRDWIAELARRFLGTVRDARAASPR